MPTISVILPVYNAAAYLREAIDSILQQSFTDFDLLIINDGSIDNSEEIILSYTDQRIIYRKNDINRGLIYSLNKAIDLATGEYIARMDADDVALPERLEKQLSHIQKSNAAILATRVKLIDGNGQPLSDWQADSQNLTAKQIKKFLLTDNCIAHPTVIGKASLFKKYKYRYNQKYSEDYDLWLRVIADNYSIEKTETPLLLHRILPTSATRFKKVNIFFRLAKVKFRFLWQQMKSGRFTMFHCKIFVYALADLMKATGKEVKQVLQT